MLESPVSLGALYLSIRASHGQKKTDYEQCDRRDFPWITLVVSSLLVVKNLRKPRFDSGV